MPPKKVKPRTVIPVHIQRDTHRRLREYALVSGMKLQAAASKLIEIGLAQQNQNPGL